MEVALLDCTLVDEQCAGLEIILECSSKGTWKGFRVPQSFYVVVRLTSTFPKFTHHVFYCDILELTTLGESVGYRIL
jgi:hypothetical protein